MLRVGECDCIATGRRMVAGDAVPPLGWESSPPGRCKSSLGSCALQAAEGLRPSVGVPSVVEAGCVLVDCNVVTPVMNKNHN